MKKFTFSPYPYNEIQLQERISSYSVQPLRHFSENEAYRFLLNAIDLTTLEGSDNDEKISQLCRKAIDYKSESENIPMPAAVCIYPPFVSLAKKTVRDTGIRVASVAGGFPAGQTPIDLKVKEVAFAVEQGADEIDMVISRGKFLEGRYEEVFDEIVLIREACGGKKLKVILETGELQSIGNIYTASQLAIEAGADFLKTSTGKIAVNATPESFTVMMDAIQDHYNKTHKMVGIKPAGGIADTATAILFLKILENVLGEKWLSNEFFRIGASRLADKIHNKIIGRD